MAGFIVSPETIRVLLHWTLHGRSQLNVLHGHYVTAGPLAPNIAQNIFNSVSATFASSGFASVLATTTSFVAVGVIDLRSADNPEILSTGAALPGTDVARALPDATSLVLTERTAKTGRAHRGRIYTMGWGSDNMQADGTCAAASADVAVSWFNSVNTAMTAQGAPLAIRSTAKPDRPAHGGGTLPAKLYEITPVTSISHRDLIWDTNRRRTDTLHR